MSDSSYNLKGTDFIPWVGACDYSKRNREDRTVLKYNLNGLVLTAWNMPIIIGVIKGIEKLVSN
ncbi:MAG: hypothetical protein AABW63_03210 [Nanoarchaeota archaeon]|mgnify:CR=1 FL=1